MAKAIEEEAENARKKLEEEQARKDALVKRLEEQKKSEIKGKILGVIWSIFWTIICIWAYSISEDGSQALILLSLFFAFIGWVLLYATIF